MYFSDYFHSKVQIKTPTSLQNPANRCGKTRFCVISAKVHAYPLRCLLLSCMYMSILFVGVQVCVHSNRNKDLQWYLDSYVSWFLLSPDLAILLSRGKTPFPKG